LILISNNSIEFNLAEKYRSRAELLAGFSTKDFKKDFKDVPAITKGQNDIRTLRVHDFPALAYLDISYTLFRLAPCGANIPHIHPRATELLYVIKCSLYNFEDL
jgi:hypothetical protein